MRQLFLLSSGLIALSCAHAETRTFTDTQGRTIKAELIDATLTLAKIRREDGQVFSINLETLAEADRAYIAAWSERRAAQTPITLRFNTSQFKQTAKRDRSDSTLSRVENAGYTVTIHNDSSASLENVTVAYRIFMLDDTHGHSSKKSDMALKRLAGTERIAALPTKAMTEFKTDTLTLQRSELKAGWVYIDGSKRRVTDQLAGIWLKIYRADGTQIGEYAVPETLKKEKW